MAHRRIREDTLAYTLEDAADICGMSKPMLHKFVKTGDLPAKRTWRGADGQVAGNILILRRDLEDFLECLPDDEPSRYEIARVEPPPLRAHPRRRAR